MKNVDATIIEVIDERIKYYCENREKVVDDPKLEKMLENLVQGQIKRHITNLANNAVSKFLKEKLPELVSQLFESETFLDTLKRHAQCEIASCWSKYDDY